MRFQIVNVKVDKLVDSILLILFAHTEVGGALTSQETITVYGS